MGISAANTMSYDAKDRVATLAAFEGRAARTRSYASGAAPNMAFSPEGKRAAGDRYDPATSGGSGQASRPARARNQKPGRPLVDDIEL
jgi:hypothetical protein